VKKKIIEIKEKEALNRKTNHHIKVAINFMGFSTFNGF
jgi:hypothetical protein